MIGGFDITLTGTVLDGDMEAIFRAAFASWPDAFVERGDGSFAIPVVKALRERWLIPVEVFVYASRAAYESWTVFGLEAENAEKMIAITIEADCISFIVNDEQSITAMMVRDMIESIRESRG